MIRRINKAIPKQLRGWVHKHIRWNLNEDIPTARASLRDNGYLIEFSSKFVKGLTDAELTGLWLHEIAHIVRGDVFLKLDTFENPGAFYMAVEYVINEPLRKHYTIPQGGVTGETLKQIAGEAPPAPHVGANSVYEWLLKFTPKIEGEPDFEPSEATAERRLAHAKAVLTMPSVEGLPGKDIASPKRSSPSILDITPVAEAAARLAERARDGRVVSWGKSWWRESPIYPTLEGYAANPNRKILVAFDASGSMTEWAATYWNLVQELRGIVDVDTWAWADRAAEWPRAEEMPEVGGGTQLTPLLQSIREDYTLVIVFTDGLIGDTHTAKEAARDMRIVWALVPDGQVPFEGEEVLQLGRLR